MGRRCLNDRSDLNAILVLGIAIPSKGSNDEQNYEALHDRLVVNEGLMPQFSGGTLPCEARRERIMQ